jgi:antitoxin component HigA of HigAB toxin-antitoxin module
MERHAIQSEYDYQAALARCSELVDFNPEPDTPEGNELEALSISIGHYEAEHYPMLASVEGMELAKIVRDRADEPTVTVDIKDL